MVFRGGAYREIIHNCERKCCPEDLHSEYDDDICACSKGDENKGEVIVNYPNPKLCYVCIIKRIVYDLFKDKKRVGEDFAHSISNYYSTGIY